MLRHSKHSELFSRPLILEVSPGRLSKLSVIFRLQRSPPGLDFVDKSDDSFADGRIDAGSFAFPHHVADGEVYFRLDAFFKAFHAAALILAPGLTRDRVQCRKSLRERMRGIEISGIVFDERFEACPEGVAHGNNFA